MDVLGQLGESRCHEFLIIYRWHYVARRLGLKRSSASWDLQHDSAIMFSLCMSMSQQEPTTNIRWMKAATLQHPLVVNGLPLGPPSQSSQYARSTVGPNSDKAYWGANSFWVLFVGVPSSGRGLTTMGNPYLKARRGA